MDQYGNKCAAHTNRYDVEYIIGRYDRKTGKLLGGPHDSHLPINVGL